MGRGCLTEEHIQELVRILDKILTEHFSRYAARQGKSLTGLSRVCFCCIWFSVYSTKPGDWLRRTSPKSPVLCQVWCEALAQYSSMFVCAWPRCTIKLSMDFKTTWPALFATCGWHYHTGRVLVLSLCTPCQTFFCHFAIHFECQIT